MSLARAVGFSRIDQADNSSSTPAKDEGPPSLLPNSSEKSCFPTSGDSLKYQKQAAKQGCVLLATAWHHLSAAGTADMARRH